MPNSRRSRVARCHAVWRQLAFRERRSIRYLFILQIVAAGSDLFSLGAFFPFLTSIISPDNEKISKYMPATHSAFIETDLVTITALFFLITVLASNLLKIAVSKYQLKLTADISQCFSKKILNNFLGQSLGYHLNKGTSEHIGLMTHDLNGALGVIQLTFTLVTNLMSCIAIVSALIFVSPFIAIGSSLIFVSTYFFLVINNRGKLVRNSDVISSNHKRLIQIVQESLLNIRDILLDSSQAMFINEYARYEHGMRVAQNENALIRQIPRYTLEIMGAMIICAIVFLAYLNSLDYKDILPVLGLFAMGSTKLLPALQQVYASISAMQGIGVSLDKTLDCLALSARSPAQKESSQKRLVRYDVVLNNLSYSYDGGDHDARMILNNVNLVIPMNETVAFVGKSGSGKSTLADVILGLLRPVSGELIVGGKIITDENMTAWQSIVSYVPQSIFLTEATAAQNIAFGSDESEIDYALVRRAAQLACIDDFIESLEQGYKTILGYKGNHLSGGQRQRIGIARALYKGSKFLVLDEATSALDRETEANVMASIRKISGLLTIVIITHKKANTDHCSIVYEMKNGKVLRINA